MAAGRFRLGVALNTLVLAAALTAPASACPPSLTVERAAPSDGAFLLLHASRGCHSGALTVTGTAEGLVAGVRRSIPLVITPGSAKGRTSCGGSGPPAARGCSGWWLRWAVDVRSP